ncbi:hypothetical protein BI364_13345 [Acidihalobacter yilgarnensis]|uniref:EamA domain-containing protein n=1 Tax=Acidihalobacter yilgarnensis TaxID=2819280 RepID=A0A1D8IQM6_9GAMM|nr:hypothetical protein BI364_13345 [Acidihalobacter yilgarnensis]
MTRHPMFGLVLALFGALTITPDTLFMRWSEMSGAQMLVWRGLLMGGVFVAAWMVVSHRTRKADIRGFFSGEGLAVVLCQFVSTSLFSLGVAMAPVSVVLFGVASVPVFSAVFGFLLLGDGVHWSTWLAIVAVITGIGIAVFGGGPSAVGGAGSVLLGAVSGLGVAISLALTFVSIRRNPEAPILLTVGVGALLSGVAALFIIGPAAALQGNIGFIAITGIVILPVSFFSLSLASRHTLTANVSLVMLMETVLGPLWVWLGTGERPTSGMLMGGVIVVGSLALYLGYSAYGEIWRRRETPVVVPVARQ